MPRINPRLAAVDLPPIPEAHAWAAAYDGRHGPLIDLCQAVPGYSPHPDVLAKSAQAAGDPAHARYGLIPGDAGLREAYVTELNAVYGGQVTPEQVAITAGCNQAFMATLMTLAGHGENVLLPTPWFWNHQQSCAMLGIEPRPLPCGASHGFIPDPADAEPLIDSATRAIVLITPNNPTGAVYPPEVIAAFHGLCAKHGITLILDETYRDFLPPGQERAHELFRHADWPGHLVQLYSFSKAYCVPGHRVGALTADAGFVAETVKVLDCLHICPNRVAQAALAWAIPNTQAWRAGNRQIINERADAMRDAFQFLPEWRIESSGAYFAYVRHPHGGRRAADVAERLATGFGAVALPGSAFGPGQEGHLRLAFANSERPGIADLARRLARMPAW